MPATPPPASDSSSSRLRWRRRPWWVRYLGYTIGAIAFLLLSYGGWCLWSHLSWRRYVAEVEASGSALTLPELLPVPYDAEIFWTHPIVTELRESETSPLNDSYTYLERVEPRFDFMEWSTHPDGRARGGSWRNAHPSDLSRYFPRETIDHEEAASRLLKALTVFDREFEALLEAVDRAPSAFPWESHLGAIWETPTSIGGLKYAGEMLTLRGLCRLAGNDPEGALEDLITVIRLSRHLSCEGTLIDQLVGMTIASIGWQIAWDGLHSGAWDEDQLARLEGELSESLQSRHSFERLLEIERAYGVGLVEEKLASPTQRWRNADEMALGGLGLIDLLSRFPSNQWLESAEAWINRVLFTLTPRSEFYRNFATRDQIHRGTLLNPALSLSDRIEAEKQAIDRISDRVFRDPTTFMNTTAFGAMLARIEESENLRQSVRTAVAAERVRLTTGAYPESWSDLVPRWIPSTPQDAWAGGDQRYFLDAEGRPVIYSIGSDLTDEGGTPRRRRHSGDLVWRYSLPPGITLDDYWD